MDIMGKLFTSSGGGDPFWSSVTLLAFNDNAGSGTTTFLDQSPLAQSLTRLGSAAYTSSVPPPGMATSVDTHFIATGVSATSSSAFAFGTADFTIEFWIRFNTLSQSNNIADFRVSIPGNPPTFYDNGGSDFWVSWNATAPMISGALPSNATWCHYAFCRSGTDARLFLDGTQTGSTVTDSTNFGNSGVMMGNAVNLTTPFDGLMGPFRVTKAARYTSGFSVPTLPFPNS